MLLLITYDISSNKRRAKVEKILSSYGYRVNFSVFELDIDESQYEKLIKKLKKHSKKEDNIRIYIFDVDVVERSYALHHQPQPFEFRDGYI